MWEFVLAIAAALVLGIQTSISPCPMATNIAAISYIGRKVGNARYVFLSGLLYTLGRLLTYIVLGMLVVTAVTSKVSLSNFLQFKLHAFIGPILILIGMVLLGMIRLPNRGRGISGPFQARIDAMGIWGAFILGVLFALSFCPVSAGFFFGGLMTLALKTESRVVIPCVYGIGTALPVLGFAVLIAVNAQAVGKVYDRMAQIEIWARRITGTAILVVGLHLTLVYVFGINLPEMLKTAMGLSA